MSMLSIRMSRTSEHVYIYYQGLSRCVEQVHSSQWRVFLLLRVVAHHVITPRYPNIYYSIASSPSGSTCGGSSLPLFWRTISSRCRLLTLEKPCISASTSF